MEPVQFDYDRLRCKIREKFKTEGAFAREIGIGRVSLSGRLNNKLDFSRIEIMRACAALDVPGTEISDYFFTKKVQKSEQSSDYQIVGGK